MLTVGLNTPGVTYNWDYNFNLNFAILLSKSNHTIII